MKSAAIIVPFNSNVTYDVTAKNPFPGVLTIEAPTEAALLDELSFLMTQISITFEDISKNRLRKYQDGGAGC